MRQRYFVLWLARFGLFGVLSLVAACIESKRTTPDTAAGETDVTADTGVVEVIAPDVPAPTEIEDVVEPEETATPDVGTELDTTPVCAGGCGPGACTGPDLCDCSGTGFEGQNCQTPLCEPPCLEGRCIAVDTCECAPGFVGPRCGQQAVCASPCLNGGLCLADGTCDCRGTGFAGERCEQRACNGIACPALTGYAVDCNVTAHCEYIRISPTEAWHADDIWIQVPAAAFAMGSAGGEGQPEERPQHQVTVAQAYLIGKLEVSVRMHEACAVAGACSYGIIHSDPTSWGLSTSIGGRARHPQNGLSWELASEVCAFVGGRLPTEAEWELAANGPGEHRLYPWGNSPAPICETHAIFDFRGAGCGTGGTAMVGPELRLAGSSPVGALDLVGNLGEWVEDCWHDDFSGAPSDGSAWTTACSLEARVIRGGNYYFAAETMRAATRSYGEATTMSALYGARCVRDVPAGAR